MNTDNTEWRPITNFAKRYVMNIKGEIKSLVKNKILKAPPNIYGYCRLPLVNDNDKIQNVSIHRMLLSTFYRLPKEGEMVNHKNGIKHDNRLENLEWCTQSENFIHARRVLGRKVWNAGKSIPSFGNLKKWVEKNGNWRKGKTGFKLSPEGLLKYRRSHAQNAIIRKTKKALKELQSLLHPSPKTE